MSDPLASARSRLRWLNSVEALIEARQADAVEFVRHGHPTTFNVEQLAAELRDAQALCADLTAAAADAITDPKEDA